MSIKKEAKKKIQDDTLEYYGLSEEDIENIEKEEEIDGDIVLLEAKIRVLLEENRFNVKEGIITDFLKKLGRKENVYNKIYKIK